MFGFIGAIVTAISTAWGRYQERKQYEHQAKVEIIKARTSIEIKKLENDAGQIELNKANALSGNRFDSGWRPFIGWGCGIIVILNGFIYETAAILGMFGIDVAVPDLNSYNEFLIQILVGMLGLGTAVLRSYDKKELVRQLLNRDLFYAKVKELQGGKLTNAQVDLLEKAIDAADD